MNTLEYFTNIILLLLLAFIGFYLNIKQKVILEKYHFTYVLFSIMIVNVIAIFFYSLFVTNGNIIKLGNEMTTMIKNNWKRLLEIGLLDTLLMIIGFYLLNTLDISELALFEIVFNILFAFIGGYYMLNEKITIQKIIGAFIIISGIIITNTSCKLNSII